MVFPHPGALLIVLLAAAAVAAFTTLVYKYATNQEKMAQIKGRLKDLQKEMKEARGNHEKMFRLNSEIMKAHNEYSMQSMRSLLFTMIPVMLVFFYLQGAVAFDPITPGETFQILIDHTSPEYIDATQVEVQEGFTVHGSEPIIRNGFLGLFGKVNGLLVNITAPQETGNYTIVATNGGSEVAKEILVTEEAKYARDRETYDSDIFKAISIEYDPLRLIGLGFLPNWAVGWLAVYIVFTIIFTNLFRKILKVH